MPDLPADIKDPDKKRRVLSIILGNCNAKIAELQDRKELIEHEMERLI